MMTKEFKLLYDRLNPEQKRGVDTVEGPVMVIAGPGTGKTQVLILRIANILLNAQIEPENILVLTFTESAAYEMRKRLVALIGTPGYRVEISTFHGFCNNLIQHHGDEFDNLASFEAVDELEQMEIVETILNTERFRHIRPMGAPLHYIRSILSTISDLKKEGVRVDAFAEGIKKQEADFLKTDDLYHEKGIHKGIMKGKYSALEKKIEKNKELLVVYRRYEEMLRARRKYDYNDMLLEVIRAFRTNTGLLLQMQELYQYFLVDEHQDTNRAQNDIIELLCNYHPNPNLFVVGDEKQAIFRFQGATLENFLYFKNLYKGATLINLSENYRSTQMILDAAHSLISHNPKSVALLPHNLKAAVPGREELSIEVAKLSSFYGEYRFLVEDIRARLEKGVEPREIAVLARNNKDIEPMVEALEKEGIQFIVESSQNVFQDLTIRKLITLFYAIHRLGSDKELIEAMHIDIFGIAPIDIYRIVRHAQVRKTFVWDVLTGEEFGKLALKNPEAVFRFVDRIEDWKTKSMNDSFDNTFIDILNNSGFLERVLGRKDKFGTVDKIGTIYNDIKRLVAKDHSFNLDRYIAYIELLDKHKISLFTPTPSTLKPGIRLMTAHKAKGLEFDYVYIINAFDGHWGNKRKESRLFLIPWEHLSVKYDTVTMDGANEDERRLFYVALTRARRQVTVSYSTAGIDGKEQVMTQFVEEITPGFRTERDTSAFEKEFAAHPEMLLLKKKERKMPIEEEFRENKQFFNDMFRHRGLSVSALNNYMDCPWKYFFRNLLLLPDVKSTPMIFGSSIHEALNSYLRARETKPVGEEFVVEEYKKSLGSQPLSERELLELTEKGTRVIRDFYREKASKWKKGMLSELNIRGIRFTEHIFLNGKIDMIERLDAKGNVAVYDFKTGKPKSRAYIEGDIKSGNGDYKRQLVFYKILLDRFKEGRLKMTMQEGVIEFVEKNDKGAYQTERFAITDEETKELEKLIVKVSNEILDLNFLNETCDDKDCDYCKLRSFMERA